MIRKIALAGNPNSGKTTLFNALTGSNQFVGNWPGVTVEKKEGRLKGCEDVLITDLPGIYSLSPYTPEETVARRYLIEEHPDAILNIVDGTNLERNLYLTTQLLELGIPTVVAINMMDVVKKRGDVIDCEGLSHAFGCPVKEISALKGDGANEAARAALEAAQAGKAPKPPVFSGATELALSRMQAVLPETLPADKRRWYAVKLFERDELTRESPVLRDVWEKAEADICAAEKERDDDSESIITDERYTYAADLVKRFRKAKHTGAATPSDRIDRIVTSRVWGLPIFAAVMFLVYYISMVTVGVFATDFANDGLFGDGWHLFGIGSADYADASESYSEAGAVIDGYLERASHDRENKFELVSALGGEAGAEEKQTALRQLLEQAKDYGEVAYTVTDEETLSTETFQATYDDLTRAAAVYENAGFSAPDPSDYGVWIPGIPVLAGAGLDAVGCAEWLKGLLVDGVIAGVGAVLGFVPQMFVLFLMLAFLESCGYMARIAFVLDRVFRRFGLSGKSFIPMLVGTGCGVPGIMASRTIENQRDRRMTVMTTTFIPCGAKIPFISMIAGAVFGGSAWVATSAYFVGMAAVIMSGLALKKTKLFAGDPAPFVMELPAYHLPTAAGLWRSVWERGSSFIRKAGTVILLSSVVIWFATFFGFADGRFVFLSAEQIDASLLAGVGRAAAWIFAPLGWGTWQATVASVTGLIAKENIVGTLGILYGAGGSVYEGVAQAFSPAAGYSFLVFNLLCAPCFAAVGAIRREMNSARWTWFAIGWQCAFAYGAALVTYQFGRLFAGEASVPGLAAAGAAVLLAAFLVFRRTPEQQKHSSRKRKETAAC